MADDYKNEILPRLQTSALYLALTEHCKKKDPEVIAAADAGVAYAYQRSKTVLRHMGEYTLHDGDHLFRVLYLMELLIEKKNIPKLHAPELMLLILAAFFHDIGMAPSEREVTIWEMAWNLNEPIFTSKEDIELFSHYKRYLLTKEDDTDNIAALLEVGDKVKAQTIKGYLLAEYIRQTHAHRSRAIIDKDPILGENMSNRIKFRQTDLTVDFANICYSHNEDAIGLLEMDKNLICGQDTYACLPFIGVILRLADLIDFDAKRTPSILYSHLNIKHPVSLIEWQKHRSVENWDIHPDQIMFSAKCDHPAIEAAIRQYCDYIDAELSVCNNILNALGELPKFQARGILIKLPLRVNRDKIEANRDLYNQPKYIYRDTKFTLSKQQVVDLLMGTKLYGHPEVALRELLQNSLDACLLRQAMEDKWRNSYIPEVKVTLFKEDGLQILQVEDNGTGMDQSIIDNYYTKVGASFYKSAEFRNLQIDTGTDMKPTSRFGIGILSTFMVADTLVVDTMKIYGPQKSSDALNLTAEGQESIFWIRPGNRTTVGTTTKLILRKGKNPWDKMTDDMFIQSVVSIIPNPPFPVIIQAGDKLIIRDKTSFTKTRPTLPDKNTWVNKENVNFIEFGFIGNGITGCCIVAILENENKPVFGMETKEKTVLVDGQEFPLSKIYKMADNQITIKSTTIGIDKLGNIKTEYSLDDQIRSASAISLHGIEVPAELFPERWRVRNNQVRLSWPFPINLVVDVSSPMDLDLNSARSEILTTDKLAIFEEQMALYIGYGLKKRTSKEYWKSLKEEIVLLGGDTSLKRGFNQADVETDEPIAYPTIFEFPEILSLDDVSDGLPF